MKIDVRRFRFSRGLPACLLFLFLAAGLYGAPRKDVPPAGETMAFTDSTGRTLELPATINRIAPSGSLAQMFLLALAPDLICAVSSAYTPAQEPFIPPYLMDLPAAGQFYGTRDMNPEEIARIGPDVIIDVGESKDSTTADMNAITESIAVPAAHITATFRTTAQAFRSLGILLGREEQAEKLARFCEKTLARAEETMAKVGGNKKDVLYCLGPGGLNVLAAGSFHAEILDWLANNRAVVDNPSSRGGGNETNMEQLLLWDPEIIIFGPGSVYGAVAEDPVWQQLRAIGTDRYYETPQGPYNWMGDPPSINRYLGILWLLKILYPEYAEYDLYEETAEYYRLFYNRELSREQFQALTANSVR